MDEPIRVKTYTVSNLFVKQKLS